MWKNHRNVEQFSRLGFVKNTKDNTVHKIMQSFSTKSNNCVYVIFCLKCSLKYVGETKNALFTRLTQHRYNIRHKKVMHTLIVQHFLLHGLESLRMAGLQRSEIWTDWERKWIYVLGTREQFGLNMKL